MSRSSRFRPARWLALAAPDRRRAPPLAEMYIDVGAGLAEAAAALGVAAGDPAVVGVAGGPAPGRAGLLRLAGARVAGPALDDRAGCAALVALIRSLAEAPLPVDLIVAFTAQEEVGTRGARYLAHRLAAALAVAVDTAAAARTGIAWQREVTRAGATDARQLQIAAPAGGLGIPIRYAHSPVEVLDLDDLAGAVELLRALVRAR